MSLGECAAEQSDKLTLGTFKLKATRILYTRIDQSRHIKEWILLAFTKRRADSLRVALR